MHVQIINIMPHGPAYHFSSDGKPDVWWEKPDGSWLGFWAREWPDLLGEAVLKQTDQYEWEVWQPDYRADRIYSKTLETGVTHRLFPAEERIYKLGFESRKGFFSEAMISYLKESQNNPIILKLYGTYGLHLPFYHEILKIFGPVRKFPIFFLGLGMFKSPASEMFGMHRPLTYLGLIFEHFIQKKFLSYLDIISEMDELSLSEIKRVYNGRIEKLIMGCDFDFWIPVATPEFKKSIRKKLNIPQGKIVFLASGNFIPRKQLDKLVEVFRNIANRDDCFLHITGHGEEANTKRLASLAASLVKQRKAILYSYVGEEELRNLYWASDFYISVATEEGGPVSVMKAMACGLPIISTPVGVTSELMKKHNVGTFVPVKKYNKWVTILEKMLDNGLPNPLDIQAARDAYNWPNVAKRYIDIYHDLFKIYF
ncbi:MAG: glycosyltransferase [Candidatus Brocadiales bacterium]|nr:glycosyltransferase [Candidatus Brocadiales bacterium]